MEDMGDVRVDEDEEALSDEGDLHDSDKTQIVVYFFGDAYSSPFDLNDMSQQQKDHGFVSP